MSTTFEKILRNDFGHQPRSVRRCQQAGWLARLHKDAALICKREKRTGLHAHHAAEADRWRKTHDLIYPIAKRDTKGMWKQWEEAKTKGQAAMAEFSEKRQKGMF